MSFTAQAARAKQKLIMASRSIASAMCFPFFDQLHNIRGVSEASFQPCGHSGRHADR
jgi:hypothetical protein